MKIPRWVIVLIGVVLLCCAQAAILCSSASFGHGFWTGEQVAQEAKTLGFGARIAFGLIAASSVLGWVIAFTGGIQLLFKPKEKSHAR